MRLGIQCWQMSVEQGLRYEVLKAFERAYPRVRLIWENSIPKRCVEGLRDEKLDIVVMSMPENPEEYELTPLRRSCWSLPC